MKGWIRTLLATLTGAVGLTAVAGGAALFAGSIAGNVSGSIIPDHSYLGGSPFASYVGPGLLLAVVVGGTPVVSSILVARGSVAGPFAVAVAGFGMLIWIFVQMMFIPFSVLQALYFAAGLAELGLLMLGLGLLKHGRVGMIASDSR